MAYVYLENLVKGKKANRRQKNLLCPQRLATRSLCGKSINNIHDLYSFYYYLILPKIRHGRIIRSLEIPKICCLSHLNIWSNLLDPLRKRQTVMRMKVDINKVIYPVFGRTILSVCRNDHDWMPLSDPTTNLPPCHIQEMPCLSLVILLLELSDDWLKALVPASYFPTLILSSEKKIGPQ